MGYLKTNRFFCPDLGKKGPIWPLDRVFWIFWKILSLVFLGNNLKRKLILLLIFHDQSHIWQNFGSLVMGQNTFSQSNCRINVISQEKSLLQVDTQSFWVCESRHAQRTQNKKFAYLCNISRKAWGLKLIFYLQMNTKVFYKLRVSLWVCVARHAQSTQNKFTISL